MFGYFMELRAKTKGARRWLAPMGALVLAVACSPRAVNPLQLDGSPDQKRTAPPVDLGVRDLWLPRDVSLRPDAPRPLDGLVPGEDARWDQGAVQRDGWPGDGLPGDSDAPSGDPCSSAPELTFAGDTIVMPGTTWGADNDVFLTSLDCTSYPTAGPDLFFKLQLVQGYRYRFELAPSSSDPFNAAMYLFDVCYDPADSCGAGMGVDRWGVSDRPEELVFVPAATGMRHLGIDGRTATDDGHFELTVTREQLAANDACTAATPLTLVGGWVEATGDTGKGEDDVDLTATLCSEFGQQGTPGPDLFYAVVLEANKHYAVDAMPTGGSDYAPAVYVFTDCARAEATLLGCHCSDWPAGSAHLEIAPPAAGTYYIGVDSVADGGITRDGPFSLEVKQIP